MWALIKDNVIVNTIVLNNPEDYIPPDDHQLIQIESGGVGWSYNDGVLTPPADPDPAIIEAKRIASLWQAAHDYEYAEISGSAVGLLAIGVMQGKPKCIAVQNWIHGIWAEYYTRKAGTSTDTDYSVCGTIPHTIPEIMNELGL